MADRGATGALASRQGVAPPTGGLAEALLARIERIGRLSTRNEVVDIADHVVELFPLGKQLAVATPERVDEPRDGLEAVWLGIVQEDDAASISGLAFTTA